MDDALEWLSDFLLYHSDHVPNAMTPRPRPSLHNVKLAAYAARKAAESQTGRFHIIQVEAAKALLTDQSRISALIDALVLSGWLRRVGRHGDGKPNGGAAIEYKLSWPADYLCFYQEALDAKMENALRWSEKVARR